jgi:hypothetical protein
MDDRSKLTLIRGIKSGAFSDRQKLEAVRAIKADDDNKAADLIGSLQFTTLNSGKSLEDLVNERQGRDRDNFDYSTGADGKLRSLMSFGETDKDREAILESLVGADGYVRDAAGRLALTEEGQKARGMEPVGKNVVIEDEGFSMRDISDLAGILPETIGSIGGAIAGGGLTFGLGSIAGAGAGAAAGQAVEEALEQMFGVQTQTLGEVARDVAIEGAIGAGGEVIGAAVVGAGRGIVGAGRGLGRRAMVGRGAVDELADARIGQAEGLLERGYIPSLEFVGAPRPLAYGQKFAENAGKVNKRIDNNLRVALDKKEEFLSKIVGDPVEQLGEDIMWYAPSQFSKLERARNTAQSEYLKAVDDSIGLLSKSIDEGVDLNKESLGRITKAFNAFDQGAKQNFRAVDDMLSQIQKPISINGQTVVKEGGQLKLFDVRGLRGDMKEYMAEMRNLADPAAQQIDLFLRLAQDGNKMSFSDMATLRKGINDTLYFGGPISTKAAGVLDGMRTQIDDMMDGVNILDDIRVGAGQLTPDEQDILQAAAKQRNFAIQDYRKGMQRFEKLSDFGIIRNVKDLKEADGYGPKAIADQFFRRIVRDDSPDRIKAVLEVAEKPNELRDMLARRYIDDALETAGRDPLNPEAFNGKSFANRIKKLKSSGPELFGNEWGEIQRLAKVIGRSSGKKNLTLEQIERVADDELGGSIAAKMRNIKAAQDEVDLMGRGPTGKLKDTSMTFDEAVKEITKPNLKESEARRIMRFFDNNPQMQENMKNVVLQDILASVDDELFKTTKNAEMLRETLKTYNAGALKRILGDETYTGLKGFGDDLAALGDVSKEGSIAAGSLWALAFKHPMQALGRIGKIKLFANALSSPTAMKKYIQVRKAGAADPADRGRAMLDAINEVMVEQGVDPAATMQTTGALARGTGRVVGQAGRVNRATLPRVAGITTQQRGDTIRTSVPDVAPTAAFDIPAPAVRAPAPTRPMGPIQQLQANVQSEIRRRARENPAVAATLLGGLGSADLL